MRKQVLLPEYRAKLCKYCGGRGFYLIPAKPFPPEKEFTSSEVVECKFCGGTGLCT